LAGCRQSGPGRAIRKALSQTEKNETEDRSSGGESTTAGALAVVRRNFVAPRTVGDKICRTTSDRWSSRNKFGLGWASGTEFGHFPRSSNSLPHGAKSSWRWRESNPRPLSRWRRHLRAQPSVSFRCEGPQRRASHSPIRNQSLPSGPGPRRTHPALRRPVPARQAPPGRTGCVI
jgi:hypothetical protein